MSAPAAPSTGTSTGPAGLTGQLAPVPADREPLLWLTPAPLWEGGGIGAGEPAFEQPWLVELTSDEFVEEFTALVSGADPAGPAGLADRAPADGSGTGDDPLVLYQPIHQRYYLVVGSLVCRRIGLPDRTVLPRGQRVSFVVRRLTAGGDGGDGGDGGGEQAWRPADRRWVDVADPLALVEGEEQHPMQAAPLGVATATGPAAQLLGLDAPGRRQVHFGYVPVAGRAATPQPFATPDEALDALADDPDRAAADDPRLLAFRLRITAAWADVVSKASLLTPAERGEPSLYVLLDLRDWLASHLPAVLTALVEGATLPAGSPREALRDHLDVQVNVSTDGGASWSARDLGTVLGELAGYEPLLHGAPIAEPATRYDVTLPLPPGGFAAFLDALAGGASAGSGGLVLAALVDPAAPGTPATVPDELQGLIVPRPDDPAALTDRHVLRLVYEHEPCAPVVSKPSPVVRFAGVYDPDAPARQVRIELPDPDQLRRFNRGVGLEMPPKLRRILEGVTPKILKEEKPGPEGGWELGMICTFSLQIIFLLAFIVMFIFLLLLNIVFWWLPFLKICFPIPKKRSASP